MADYSFTQTTEIDAPIDEVWGYVSTNDTWRRPFIRGVRQVSGDGMEVGARYENDAGPGMTIVNEITALEPPHLMSWTQVNTDAPLVTREGVYRLEDLGDRTRFTLTVTGEANGIARLFSPLLPWASQKLVGPKLLRQLREAIERS